LIGGVHFPGELTRTCGIHYVVQAFGVDLSFRHDVPRDQRNVAGEDAVGAVGRSAWRLLWKRLGDLAAVLVESFNVGGRRQDAVAAALVDVESVDLAPLGSQHNAQAGRIVPCHAGARRMRRRGLKGRNGAGAASEKSCDGECMELDPEPTGTWHGLFF